MALTGYQYSLDSTLERPQGRLPSNKNPETPSVNIIELTPEERVRACYQHAALKYVSGQRMKNATLCERFGINPQNAAQASSVIRRTLGAGLIRAADPAHPRAGYVPFWA